MASPLDHNPQFQHYWSTDLRDTLFGAHHNSFSFKYSGSSVCHPIYTKEAMTQALRHACYLLSHSQQRGHCYFHVPPCMGTTHDN
eukprot:548635-Pelagomonas_calceolata.AAC.1